jgi:muramoyltetrapeptide carboxypeptidase
VACCTQHLQAPSRGSRKKHHRTARCRPAPGSAGSRSRIVDARPEGPVRLIGARLAAQTIFHKARALRPGDSVAVIAPAGPFDRASFEAGAAIIGERYHLHYDSSIFERQRYLAGTDERRLSELNRALTDPTVRAVFCARGGYGSLRLLEKLDQPRAIWPDTGRPLIGFSDITALHQWRQRHGFISIHGPVLTQLGRLGRATRERLFSLLESDSPATPLCGTLTLVEGTAEGPLLGGNLSVFTRLLGTPFMPNLDGAILLLEDVGERPYRLDRMWTHLQLAGVFRKVRGIVLGSFNGCEEPDESYASVDVLRELAVATGLPCAAGFPIGHGDANEPVPLGVRVRLDATAARLTFLEPAVAA